MEPDADWTIYHNPRCSKSRAAVAYLRARGVEPAIVEYLKTPLDRTALDGLLRKLGAEPRDILRDGYAELPTAPGLGVELDEDVLASRPYEPARVYRRLDDDGAVLDV
jgi:arsenate reductase